MNGAATARESENRFSRPRDEWGELRAADDAKDGDMLITWYVECPEIALETARLWG
jgi:hypothetical protein